MAIEGTVWRPEWAEVEENYVFAKYLHYMLLAKINNPF